VSFNHLPVVVRGGGDLASGVIYRLFKAGFPVFVTELERPLVIRRMVAFASAVYEGDICVEGITARLAENVDDARRILAGGMIPVLVDPRAVHLLAIGPAVVVDARMAKRNLGTKRTDARLVIALGPGFVAGDDCHAIVETKRGHYLGRVIWKGSAQPNTGRPGDVEGWSSKRVLRSPGDGYVVPRVDIGERVRADMVIATVNEQPVVAPFDGVLRGLIHPSVEVTRGLKIGDVDPRGVRDHCFTISEKALAIGGGVLEAILSAPQLRDMGA